MKISPIHTLPTRIFRGLLFRFIRLERQIVLHAPPNNSVPLIPEGFILFRAYKGSSAHDQQMVEDSMQANDEPEGLVSQRLEHGDEFLGWLCGDKIVSFGWVTHRDRFLGKVRCKDMVGRVFLYNFHTSDNYRGRGLYPSLLLKMRQVLGQSTVTDIIIDVNAKNISSIRGIEKAEFTPVAQLVSLVIFNHWQMLIKQIIIDSTVKDLFEI